MPFRGDLQAAVTQMPPNPRDFLTNVIWGAEHMLSYQMLTGSACADHHAGSTQRGTTLLESASQVSYGGMKA